MKKSGNMLLRNHGLKLLALLMAITIWYALRQITSHEILIESVPIEFRAPHGLAVLQPSVETVDISFQGSQEDLRLLDRKQIKVVLDIKKYENEGVGKEEAQTNYFNKGVAQEGIKADNVRGSGSARVLRIVPGTVTFQLDHKIQKTLPVKARQTGKPLHGEAEITCDPGVVTVSGPAQHIAKLELIHTEPVDVEGRVAAFTKLVRLARPEGGWTFDITQTEVRVSVSIKEQSESRDLPETAVMALLRPGAQHRAVITPIKVAVRLTGHSDELDKALQLKPRVFVDCADLEIGVPYELPLTVSLAPDLKIAAVTEPKFVRVTLESSQP